jgi:hypothetical protein
MKRWRGLLVFRFKMECKSFGRTTYERSAKRSKALGETSVFTERS